MNHCQRCGKPTGVTTMSQFNTQTICMTCSDRERAHPLYETAVDAELAEIRAGNFNYRGIGLPPDLAAPEEAPGC